ncbi:30S ribosomal protein S21 [Candidatus Tremblaya princeps]|uniref:Small ribosomal subunit protein bS21 n=1 Tax=Tremblaya princeps TaxID=189385 RepID=A0A143WNB0_TREPR|nr:30S ribosomal protein S21 [Candidatus Tremblaya princeps]
MSTVVVRDTEPFEAALRRFRRMAERSGMQSELRRRSSYEKPTARRKRKRAAALMRIRRRCAAR